jgi:hypothetical protein
MNGYNYACMFILPMLGKHPDDYPRFRDCFTEDDENPEYNDHIHIYTRTGGGNREEYENENEEITCMEGFVTDYDDFFDNTYAHWVFKIPEKFISDYKKIKDGLFKDTSEAYKQLVYKIYPTLANKIFNNGVTK